MLVSSSSSPIGSVVSSVRSRSRSARSVSACELTETYSPAAIDNAPATRPATPASRMSLRLARAAATPTTRLAVETMPSLAPSTAARSQPIRSVRCRSRCRIGCPIPRLSRRRRAREGDARARRSLLVIPDEALRFARVVLLQIHCPSIRDRLKPQLSVHLKWPLPIADLDRVADAVATAGKIRVLLRIAVDRDLFIRGALVEPSREQTVVFDITYCRQQTRGHGAVGPHHDRLVDLDLILPRYLTVVRFEAHGVVVVVVAANRTIRVQRSGLEHNLSVAVPNGHMKPRTAGGVRGRKLVAAEVSDGHDRFQPSVPNLHVLDGHGCGFRLQMIDRALDGRVHFLRLGLHGQVRTKPVQDPLHEEIAADEGVPRKTHSRLAEDRGDPHLCFDHRHVARLTTACALEVAVLPLLVRHLFRQLADDLALRIQGLGDERMARGAQLRRLDVFALCRFEGRR